MELQDPRPVDTIVEPLKIDDLLLCGMCGCVNKITLLGTEPLTETEFNTLDESIKRDLDFARRAIQRRGRN